MKEVLYKFKNGEGDEFRLRLVSDSRQFLSEEMSSLVEKEDFEFVEVDYFGNADRGGFGSSGKRKLSENN